jgi:hypothetical protein
MISMNTQGVLMSEETNDNNPTTYTPRKPSFWMPQDVFIRLWANNQKALENEGGAGSKKSEELYHNYRSLCLNLFERLGREKDTHGRHLNPEATLHAHVPILADKTASKQAKDDAIYEFMKEKVKTKAEALIKKLHQHNKNVKMPYGVDNRNWYKSKTATLKELADLFE